MGQVWDLTDGIRASVRISAYRGYRLVAVACPTGLCTCGVLSITPTHATLSRFIWAIAQLRGCLTLPVSTVRLRSALCTNAGRWQGALLTFAASSLLCLRRALGFPLAPLVRRRGLACLAGETTVLVPMADVPRPEFAAWLLGVARPA